MKNKNSFFITSTGTEIGKTFITVKIIDYLIEKRFSVEAYKPVLSGFNNKNIKQADSAKLLNAMRKNVSMKNIRNITPWLFKKPLAPSIAAKYEKKSLSYKALIKWCIGKQKSSLSQYVLFEGAGGVMVPLQKKNTFVDLFYDIKTPVLLVAGSYLGTISHTLSAVEALENKNVEIINIILNEGRKEDKTYSENLSLLKNSIRSRIIVRPFSYNSNLHDKQINLIANDIIKYFKKLA